MKRPEEILHRQIVRFIDAAYPGLLYFHVPNGGGRSRAEAGALKAMGVKAGVPDLVVILPTGFVSFIEIKAPKGRLSDAQKAFQLRAEQSGCQWEEVRSLEELEAVLERWLLPFGVKSRVRVLGKAA